MNETPMPTGALIGLVLVFIGCMLVAAGWITAIVATDKHFKQGMCCEQPLSSTTKAEGAKDVKKWI